MCKRRLFAVWGSWKDVREISRLCHLTVFRWYLFQASFSFRRTCDLHWQTSSVCEVCWDSRKGVDVGAARVQPVESHQRRRRQWYAAASYQVYFHKPKRHLSDFLAHWSNFMVAECAGCHEELKDCQALIALDRQWHIWCFKCKSCDVVLHGEYMGK